MLNTLFMVNEIVTGEIESVEVNNEDNLEAFLKKITQRKTRI